VTPGGEGTGAVETLSDRALQLGADKGMGTIGMHRAATVHRKRQKSIGFRANEQLIDRKRPGHCVRIVSQKSSAIVTVECGAETGVWDGPCK
jgi:hypothetical protein